MLTVAIIGGIGTQHSMFVFDGPEYLSSVTITTIGNKSSKEKFVDKQLINFIGKKKNYIPIQCGLRKGHQSVQAVIEITNTLGKAIDNNLYTCGAFLDFSKAFDTVNYEIWLNKLATME